MQMDESSRVACFAVDQNGTNAAPSKSASEYKECANCGINDTPLWRKYENHDLCNACGIYFRVNGIHRPFLPNMRKLLSSARKMGLACVNCGTKITSMWRRTPEGDSICNACGLYFRLNGVKRPVSMRKDWIRKRQRKTQQISGIMRLANQTSVCSIMSSVSTGECGAPSSSCNANAPFEQSNQSHCFSSAYLTSDQHLPEYKSVDYVQYYQADYGQAMFQPMGPVHEPVGGHELSQMAPSQVQSSIPSMSYMAPSMPNYSTAPLEHGNGAYMPVFEDIKSHH